MVRLLIEFKINQIKLKMSFRITCAALGLLKLFLVIFLIDTDELKDEEIGIVGAVFVGFGGIYFYITHFGREEIEYLKQ